jgi:DNA polymerase
MKNLYNALILKQLYQLKNLGYKYTTLKPFSFEDRDMLKLPDNLLDLKKQIDNCHLCELSKSRDKIVFGKGVINAKVAFVGDYPNDMESLNGIPFLGKSGEMLNLMIEKVLEISIDEVYISNIIKCKLGTNWKLKEVYLHSCKSYLLQELNIVKPKIVITLGEKAYQILSGDYSKLEDIRGNIIQKTNYAIMPTYHPKFLIKNPSFKKDVLMDLKNVKYKFLV